MHFYNKEAGIMNKSTTWRDIFMGTEFLSIYSIEISEVKRKKKKTQKTKKSARPHPAKRRKFRSKSVNHRGKTQKKTLKR